MSVPPGRPQGVGDAEWVAQLERENEALREANARLARERLGSANTAAATRLAVSGRPLNPLRKLRLALRRLALRALR